MIRSYKPEELSTKDLGNRSRNVETGNWKFGLHVFALFFPISNFQPNLSLISNFQFQAVNGYRFS